MTIFIASTTKEDYFKIKKINSALLAIEESKFKDMMVNKFNVYKYDLDDYAFLFEKEDDAINAKEWINSRLLIKKLNNDL